MKEFFEDNWDSLFLFILIICLLIYVINFNNNSNKERLAIINNNKKNVLKYSYCEHIEDYYYCWNE